MDNLVEKQLAEIGTRLLQPSSSKDSLVKVLKQAASLFSEVEQSPPANILTALNPSMEALVQPAVLNHMDKEVRLLVATCISEILRIVAPDAPYTDAELKDIFELIVESFRGLDELTTPSFSRRVSILETVSTVKSCVVMLDLELDDLILQMFQAFFSTVREEHPQKVVIAMRDIMCVVIEESEDIPPPLLDVLLSNLVKKDSSTAAHQLAVAVLKKCAQNLEPFVRQFLTPPVSEVKVLPSGLRSDYHELVYEIYRCAPSMLVNVAGNLGNELLTDEADVRVKAVELIGKLFALSGAEILPEFKQLFSAFVKRFTDKAAEVRRAVTEYAKHYLLTKPSGPIATDLLTNFMDRLQDYDMKVRTNAVAALCEFGKLTPSCIPMRITRRIAQRLRDKEVIVRKATVKGLADLYRSFCLTSYERSFKSDETFDWIPSKLFRCCFDKDCRELRPQVIEMVFTEELFPQELPINVVVQHWIAIFSTFDKNDKKAFRRILLQKQRLQLEMQNYLLLQQKIKVEDNDEIQKRIHACCKNMLVSFLEPVKAEEDFQKLNQLKDNEILEALTLLLDPDTKLYVARICRDNLLRRIGGTNPLYEFMRILATKCSFILFGKEHVAELLKEASYYKAEGMQLQLEACMDLLVVFAVHFPVLINGVEEALMDLLKESSEYIRQAVLQILSKMDGAKIGEFIESSGMVLEKLCWEGNRKEAKYAVQAIVAGDDSGLKALSQVYANLVDHLETTTNLPTVLQSLGSIAQCARPIFETREEYIIDFVVKNLLYRAGDNEDETDGLDRVSENCQLKIYGLKNLVKSFLPHKDVHARQRLKGFLGVLVKLLECGEVSEDVKSSELDKAHLRFAVAKGVLRLSKLWDAEITPQLFHLTVLISQDPSLHVQHEFLVKVHQYLKERVIPHRYACAFPLFISRGSREILPEVKQHMADFIDSSRREVVRLKQSNAWSDDILITYYPEYTLFYLVHILAHSVSFSPANGDVDVDQVLVSIYKQFLVMIWMLLREDGEAQEDPNKNASDRASLILSIFRMIKQAEDAVDKSKYENACILSDIGIFITKELSKNQSLLNNYSCQIPLPLGFFQPSQAKEDSGSSEKDGSHLPAYISEADFLSRIQDLRSELYLQNEEPLHSGTMDGKSEASISQDEEKEVWVVPLRKHPSSHNIDGVEKGKEVQDTAAVTSTPSRGRGRRRNAKDKPTKLLESPSISTTTLEQPAPASSNKRKSRSDKDNGDLPSPEQKNDGSDDSPLESSQIKKRGRPKATNKKVDTDAGLETLSAQLADKIEGTPQTPVVEARKSSEAVDGDNLELEQKKPGKTATGKPVRLSVKKSRLGKEILSELVDENPDQTTHPDDSTKHAKESEGHPARKNVQERQEVIEKPTADQVRSPRGTPRSTRKKIPDVITDDKSADEKLIGCRIKVWWPLDKRFYEGVVQSFDTAKKKYKVCYLDGDVEFLNLAKQRWERVDDDAAHVEEMSELSPVAPTPVLSSPKKKESTQAIPKSRGKVSPDTQAHDEPLSSPRRRKNTAMKEGASPIGSPTKHIGAAINSTDMQEEVVKDSEHKMEVNEEADVAHETKSESKDAQKSRRHTAIEKGSEGLPQVASPKRVPKRKIGGADGASSPTGSKESDDAPLNTWKSRTRKVH